ncbi:hypothetical protein BT67DRAFT_235159 [Trichocladium antarcticum]|uniref:Uncharacterized protein n=1 Tax=Trichocladium antarcticum TaxID=1450529 RepID=A0AAN6UND8_9PEZI|nr:hypothetical protein BT67DRAFT_235159 [Trichocladium antarcticum]
MFGPDPSLWPRAEGNTSANISETNGQPSFSPSEEGSRGHQRGSSAYHNNPKKVASGKQTASPRRQPRRPLSSNLNPTARNERLCTRYCAVWHSTRFTPWSDINPECQEESGQKAASKPPHFPFESDQDFHGVSVVDGSACPSCRNTASW